MRDLMDVVDEVTNFGGRPLDAETMRVPEVDRVQRRIQELGALVRARIEGAVRAGTEDRPWRTLQLGAEAGMLEDVSGEGPDEFEVGRSGIRARFAVAGRRRDVAGAEAGAVHQHGSPADRDSAARI